MAYENDTMLYMDSTAVAAGAATLLWEYPVAKTIVLMMTSFLSNPQAMAAGAEMWRIDLDQLKNEIVRLRDSIKDKWEGPAHSTFTSTVDAFVEGIDQLKKNHDAAGDSLDQSARLYHVGAIVCVVVAGVLASLAAIQYLCLAYPPSKLAVRIASSTALADLATLLKGLLEKQGRAIFTLTGVIALVNSLSSQTGELFPSMKALPQQGADFSSAFLKHTKDAGLRQDIRMPSNYR
ncbi:hypothetical protein [Microtetraspora sp. NBRC 16547]|uniref:hypothetical protein n=1 Tax=Microtetraspora sp. NBRC 16547 TaxID=3030993 RepID=UPI0024A3F2E3|nr:hypothetical protein [Microtetraspora sp. NBRC 16547]GLW96141.1 hypothetical protein Misp02_02280 [Microtetraspora sp. NBRC 16547]